METNTATQPLLVDAREASRILGISTRTLWSITKPRGDLPAVRIGRAIRYSVDDLKAWIEQQKNC